MSEVVQFIRKRDLERACLIQEARAIYIPDQFVLVAGSGQKSYACNVVKRSNVSIGVVFA